MFFSFSFILCFLSFLLSLSVSTFSFACPILVDRSSLRILLSPNLYYVQLNNAWDSFMHIFYRHRHLYMLFVYIFLLKIYKCKTLYIQLANCWDFHIFYRLHKHTHTHLFTAHTHIKIQALYIVQHISCTYCILYICWVCFAWNYSWV